MKWSQLAACFAHLALCVGLAVPQGLAAQPTGNGPPATNGPPRIPQRAPDPRVQQRTYTLPTGEEMKYTLFVSSKVKKNKKAPLVVTLHGIGGTHLTMMRPSAIDLAEAGGYILLAPMGYNPRGWYGAPPPQRRGGAPQPPLTSEERTRVDALLKADREP